MCQASSDPALPATRGAHIKPRAAPEHGPVLDLRTAKEQRRARERLRSMSAMQAEVPMPSLRCDAGANLTGWRHSWDEVVEFTFTTVEDECREETAVPKTQIAGLALSYLCRYLTLAEDDSLTGGGGGTQGCSTGAAASGRRPAGVRNRSDPGEVGSSTLVSIMAAFKHLAGVHPSFDDHFCKLWPAARLTKAMLKAHELKLVQTLQWRMHPCYHTPYTALADLSLALGHSAADFELHLRKPAEAFVDASYREAETCMTFPPLVAASAAILATCTLLERDDTAFLPLTKMYLPLLSGFCGAREEEVERCYRVTLEALHNRVLARVDTGDQYLTTASLDAAEAYLMGHLPPATPDDELEEEPEPFRSDDDGAAAIPELEVSPSPVLGPTDRSSWLEDCSVETLALTHSDESEIDGRSEAEDDGEDGDETSSLAADRDEMHEWSSEEEEDDDALDPAARLQRIEARLQRAEEELRRAREEIEAGEVEVGAPGRASMPPPKELESFRPDEWSSDGDDEDDEDEEEGDEGGEFDLTCHDEDEVEGGEFEGDLTCQAELGPISPFLRTSSVATVRATTGSAAAAPRRAGSLAPLRPCALAPYVEPAARSPRSSLLGLPYRPAALNRGRGAGAAALALSLKRPLPPKQVSILHPLKLQAQQAARGGGGLPPWMMGGVTSSDPETLAPPRKKQRSTPVPLGLRFPAW